VLIPKQVVAWYNTTCWAAMGTKTNKYHYMYLKLLLKCQLQFQLSNWWWKLRIMLR